MLSYNHTSKTIYQEEFILKINRTLIITAALCAILAGCQSEPAAENPAAETAETTQAVFDFSSKDLSGAMLSGESDILSAALQPTESKVLDEAKNIEQFKYVIGDDENAERFYITTQDDIVRMVDLVGNPLTVSEYDILGIHIGDTMEAAEAAGKAVFGTAGFNDEDVFTPTISFDDGSHALQIICDGETEKVKSINYLK